LPSELPPAPPTVTSLGDRKSAAVGARCDAEAIAVVRSPRQHRPPGL
jgi:transposase